MKLLDVNTYLNNICDGEHDLSPPTHFKQYIRPIISLHFHSQFQFTQILHVQVIIINQTPNYHQMVINPAKIQSFMHGK